MRSIILATVLALAASPALAYCPSIPDDAGSHYTQYQRALMLCQQHELAAATAERARELGYKSELLSLQLQFQQQLRLKRQLIFILPQIAPPRI